MNIAIAHKDWGVTLTLVMITTAGILTAWLGTTVQYQLLGIGLIGSAITYMVNL